MNFISNHPFQNKVAVIKNLVDRAVCLSHESFPSENLDIFRKILFFNHYLQDLIEKQIKIRNKQVKSRRSSNVDTGTQTEILKTLYYAILNKEKAIIKLDLQSKSIQFQIEFGPAPPQTQTSFNVQTKVQFKIPRIRNHSNPQKKATKFGPKSITQIKQS